MAIAVMIIRMILRAQLALMEAVLAAPSAQIRNPTALTDASSVRASLFQSLFPDVDDPVDNQGAESERDPN